MITCIIRYHIDPTKKAEFEQYARNWGQTIPRCGADLVGYFAPHEGSTTLAYGIYSVGCRTGTRRPTGSPHRTTWRSQMAWADRASDD
jgi:hypothetical protein